MDTPTPYMTYAVAGMTCDHCALSVREEVAAVPGVSEIGVDVPAGRLTVAGEGFTDSVIATAVATAGYEVIA